MPNLTGVPVSQTVRVYNSRPTTVDRR